MAKYYTSEQLAGSQQAISTSYKSMFGITAAASNMRRGKIYDLTFALNGTYATTDTEVEYQVIRQTVAATGGSAGTPSPLDFADAAFSGLNSCNPTAEGTVATEVFHLAANQRATYRWAASPGSELVYPATASNGFAFRCKGETAGYTGTGACISALFEEQ